MDTPLPDILDPLPFSSPLLPPHSHKTAAHPAASTAATLLPQTWLARPDFALILLAEIAYENDEDFRPHLPLLFHTAFLMLDSPEPLVLTHAQQLLVNLLYTLAGRHLELYDARDQNEGEYKQQVSGSERKGRMEEWEVTAICQGVKQLERGVERYSCIWSRERGRIQATAEVKERERCGY